jgi:general secretion pathway protein G
MQKKGFTLIEILVAVTIIAVLSIIGVASYISVSKRSRDVKRKSDLEQVRSALEMYRADNGFYPSSAGGFVTLSALDNGSGSGPLVSKYMPSIPVDPQTKSGNTVQYYYSAIGVSAPYYSYCICGMLENQVGVDNSCGVAPIANCNYYLKNP